MNDDVTNQLDFTKKRIRDFLIKRDWLKYHNPKNLSMSIAIEASELMELFQWEDLSHDLIKDDKILYEKTKNELVDILIYVLNFADLLDIDIFKSINEKITFNEKRFPENND